MDPSSTVLRVKRKRGTDPADALLLACKRLRPESTSTQVAQDCVSESADGEIHNSVFKLAATVPSKDAPVQTHLREALSRQRAVQALRPTAGSAQRIVGDLRSAKWRSRREERYRVLSSHRPSIARDTVASTGTVATDADPTDPAALTVLPDIQVFDIVQEEGEMEPITSVASDPETILCNSVKLIREKLSVSEGGVGSGHREREEEYVYDLYFQETAAPGWIQDILSVKPYMQESELVAEENPREEEVYEDEDDENEEGNWRNDYPDEEDSEEDYEREQRCTGDALVSEVLLFSP
ncbi:S7A6O protein, partial [Amia calva]|nr:S7A6O protein [Amia calva]